MSIVTFRASPGQVIVVVEDGDTIVEHAVPNEAWQAVRLESAREPTKDELEDIAAVAEASAAEALEVAERLRARADAKR